MSTLSARQTLSYEYDDDGQLTKRTLAWAPGAEPDGDEPGGGPDEIVTTFERSVDVAEGTQSITTTVAAGTSAAQVTTATVDLVSGKPVTHTDAMGRTTTFAYDALGRRTSMTTPGGLVTTTAYTPTQTTVTGPDGRVTRTTVDLLGRTVSVTDNVRNGALVADPGGPDPVGPRLQPRRLVDDGHRPGRPHDDDGARRLRADGQPGRGRPGSPTSSPTTTAPPTRWSPRCCPRARRSRT